MENKKKIISYAVLVTGTAMFVGTAAYVFSNTFRKTINKILAKKVKPNSKFLFVGDSNTKASFSYADQLKKAFPEAQITKIAENGKNTSWMFNELKKELYKNEKYDVIAILGGSNDISGGRPLNETKVNLDAMYSIANRMADLVVAIAPPNKDFYQPYTNEQREKLDELVDWLSKNKNVDYFINFHRITNRKDYFLPSDNYLHPQAVAHTELLNEFKEKVIA